MNGKRKYFQTEGVVSFEQSPELFEIAHALKKKRRVIVNRSDFRALLHALDNFEESEDPLFLPIPFEDFFLSEDEDETLLTSDEQKQLYATGTQLFGSKQANRISKTQINDEIESIRNTYNFLRASGDTMHPFKPQLDFGEVEEQASMIKPPQRIACESQQQSISPTIFYASNQTQSNQQRVIIDAAVSLSASAQQPFNNSGQKSDFTQQSQANIQQYYSPRSASESDNMVDGLSHLGFDWNKFDAEYSDGDENEEKRVVLIEFGSFTSDDDESMDYHQLERRVVEAECSDALFEEHSFVNMLEDANMGVDAQIDKDHQLNGAMNFGFNAANQTTQERAGRMEAEIESEAGENCCYSGLGRGKTQKQYCMKIEQESSKKILYLSKLRKSIDKSFKAIRIQPIHKNQMNLKYTSILTPRFSASRDTNTNSNQQRLQQQQQQQQQQPHGITFNLLN